MSKFHNIGDEYQWAFVATSSVEKPQTVEIWTSFTIDPSCIIGTNGKFDSQLNAVNKELNDHISEMISDRCPDYAKEFSSYYQEGMVVAVKDQIDQRWRIIQFYDYVTKDENLLISEELVSRVNNSLFLCLVAGIGD